MSVVLHKTKKVAKCNTENENGVRWNKKWSKSDDFLTFYFSFSARQWKVFPKSVKEDLGRQLHRF